MSKCIICGKEIIFSICVGVMICSSNCQRELFWRNIVRDKEEYIVIDGKVYYRETMWQAGLDKGMNGAKHRIKMYNGDVLETDDLWLVGEVPDKYKEGLQDNAEFVR